MADFIRRNLDSDGDITVGDFVVDKDVVLLAVKSRLLFFKNEWFLNTEDGTPWFQDILVKPARLGLIEGIIKRRITDTPGIVAPLVSFVMDFEVGTRKLNVAFEANDQYGNALSVKESI